MRFTAIAAAVGLAASPAYADFLVYVGAMNFLSDGGATSGQLLDMFNNPPSCDDANSHSPIFMNQANDATISGFSCDGCEIDRTVPEMDITRLEIDHDRVFSADTGGPMTIYQGDDGTYGLLNSELESFGSCERIGEDAHLLECILATDAANLFHAFTCTTDLTLPDTN